jgi:hypothetical protein
LTKSPQTDLIHPPAVRSATLAGFVGITGRLQSEWVAGFDRNQRPSSPECAGRTKPEIEPLVRFAKEQPLTTAILALGVIENAPLVPRSQRAAGSTAAATLGRSWRSLSGSH